MNKKPVLAKLAALALGLGLVTGCATTQQLEEVRAAAAKAQETADAALAAANKAQSSAGSAQNSADDALRAAADAQNAANACKEKCNRMMHKAMKK